MKRLTGITFIAVVAILALSADAAQRNKRPNIVFLLADDQALYSMGCYGNPDVKTPNMDRLARDGMAFDCHYDTTAICMASRANIMTGLFEYRNGCNFEHGNMREETWHLTYPVLLRKAGYQTAFAGKFGFEIADEGKKRGRLPEKEFDRWGGGPGQTKYATKQNPSIAHYAEKYPHSTRAYGAFGADFIRDAAKDGRHFCLSISFKAPHMPATPDPAFDHVYAGKKFTKPKNYGREHGEHFSKQSREGRQYDRFHSWGYADNYDKVMATYHQQIYGIDVALGMIRDALKKNGVEGNTVIIYTSDNGFLCGSHGYGSKVLPYEEASRVPLLIYDPRNQNSGKKLRCASLTGNVDMAPTILDLAGVPAPKGLNGRSLVPLYRNPVAEVHKSLPLINVWGPKQVHSLGVVTKDWKYIFWPFAEGEFEETEELYHTGKDRLELENKVGHSDYRTQFLEMRGRYDTLVADWKKNAVPYNNYEKFGTIFDRNIPWKEKRPLVMKK